MPIDAYALCPGGKDKKVKFCCGDLVGELEKIGRMLDGDQRQGCLDHGRTGDEEAQRPGLPDHAQGQPGGDSLAARPTPKKTLQELIAGQPNNPVALAEGRVAGDSRARRRRGMAPLQRALEAADGKLSGNLREALIGMFASLLQDGKHLAARHYLILYLQAVRGEDQSAVQTFVAIGRSPAALLFKQNLALSHARPACRTRRNLRKSAIAAREARMPSPRSDLRSWPSGIPTSRRSFVIWRCVADDSGGKRRGPQTPGGGTRGWRFHRMTPSNRGTGPGAGSGRRDGPFATC